MKRHKIEVITKDGKHEYDSEYYELLCELDRFGADKKIIFDDRIVAYLCSHKEMCWLEPFDVSDNLELNDKDIRMIVDYLDWWDNWSISCSYYDYEDATLLITRRPSCYTCKYLCEDSTMLGDTYIVCTFFKTAGKNSYRWNEEIRQKCPHYKRRR